MTKNIHLQQLRWAAAGCILFGLGSSMALAQETQVPFNPNTPFNANTPVTTQVGLGDHVAARVLNMNGYNITNLADPFFEGDAVTLGYLGRNAGWNHTVTQDIDFSGFKLLNLGDVILDGSKVYGGDFESPAILHPNITGGNLSGVSIKNVSIEVPRVTGGSFEASVLIAPVIDTATLTNSTINGAKLTGVDISMATLSGEIKIDGGRITGLADPEEDDDLMTLAATQSLLDARFSQVQDMIDSLVVTPLADVEGEDASGVSITVDPVHLAMSQMQEVLDSLNKVSGDLEINGVINGANAQYRPTPTGDDLLGILSGADIMSALHNLNAIVYKLPNGILASGIDPSTIPDEMAFVLHSSKEGGLDSIDYAQFIGPMIATLQTMDQRIKALENQLASVK